MYALSVFAHLLRPEDQNNLSELQSMILYCAAKANISKDQWEEVFQKVGAEKIEDFLELHPSEYDLCDFKPLLQRRLQLFQSNLFEEHWSKNMEYSSEEEDHGAANAAGSGLQEFKTALPAEAAGSELQVPTASAPANKRKTPTAQADPDFDVDTVCSALLCKKHRPSQNRRHKLHYWFFHAVSHGCKDCTKILVQELKVNKDAVSDTNAYDFHDFAEWFKHPEMIDYVADL